MVTVNTNKCVSCGRCSTFCPREALRAWGHLEINTSKCTDCFGGTIFFAEHIPLSDKDTMLENTRLFQARACTENCPVAALTADGEKPDVEVETRCWPSMEMLSPCENACPINTDVPGYVTAIAQGKFEKALDIIRDKNPLPSICGRVCHHPCEDVCARSMVDEPIAVRMLKRFAAANGTADGKNEPVPITKEDKIAIIGSGPAGLAAAHSLIKQGYPVTIFEALPVAGGMLSVGIPRFVLPAEAIEADVNYIRQMGVEIKLNTPIGKDLTVDDIFSQGYKAVFLAVGAHKSATLRIPGMESDNVLHALQFLKDANAGSGNRLSGRVVVIGGGNVGIDCARTAARLGASEVILTCLESREEMPAFEWEIENAEEEGVKISCSLAPQKIVAKDGRVVGLEFARVKSLESDVEGRIRPVLIEGERVNPEADVVIIAIGQALERSFMDAIPNLSLTARGSVAADPDTGETNLDGVFAAGDAVTLRSTVVEAIAAGQKVAVSIDRYLKGLDIGDSSSIGAMRVREVEERDMPQFIPRRSRSRADVLPIEKRKGSFDEVDLGLLKEAAIVEASRCMNCRTCGNCIFDRRQMCYDVATRLI